jgi:hypothetical protein
MSHSELLALVIAIAIAVNLPFGAWRTTTRKFSVAWFLSIHLPIPAIFVIRRAAGFGWDYVPVMIACAVAGQLLGGWLFLKIRPRPVPAAEPAADTPAPVQTPDPHRELHRAQVDAATSLAADVERVTR